MQGNSPADQPFVVRNKRIRLGGQLVQRLAEKCFDGNDTWYNLVVNRRFRFRLKLLEPLQRAWVGIGCSLVDGRRTGVQQNRHF